MAKHTPETDGAVEPDAPKKKPRRLGTAIQTMARIERLMAELGRHDTALVYDWFRREYHEIAYPPTGTAETGERDDDDRPNW